MRKKSGLDHTLHVLASKPLSEMELQQVITDIRTSQLYQHPEILEALIPHAHGNTARFLEEARLLNSISDQLIEEIARVSSHFASPPDELYHTLLAFEFLCRQYLNLPQLKQSLFSMHPVFADSELYASPSDALAAIDNFLTYFGTALRFLIKKQPATSDIPDVSLAKVGLAGKHTGLASEWQLFFEARSFWEWGCTEVDVRARTFDSSKSSLAIAFRVSLSRLRAFRSSRCRDRLNKSGLQPGTTRLPLEGFRDEQELIACYMTSLQYYSRNLKEVIHGASLAEWIRAYTLLKELAASTIESRGTPAQATDLVLVTCPEDIVSLFQRNGISANAAKSILRHFTFNENSRDLLDAPLIPFGTKLVILPSVTICIHAAFSLESLLKSIKAGQNHELAIIGPGLEASVRGDLVLAGLAARKVQFRTFDCDVAFILENVLFLCECKGKYIASDFNSYAQLERYLSTDAALQHSRTTEYFSKNLQHIRRELSLPAAWQPSAIIPLIITSAKLGRSIPGSTMLVVDENTFHAFFARKALTINDDNGNVVKEFVDSRLHGEMTVQAFLEFIQAPRSVLAHETFLADRQIELLTPSPSVHLRDRECYGEVRAFRPNHR